MNLTLIDRCDVDRILLSLNSKDVLHRAGHPEIIGPDKYGVNCTFKTCEGLRLFALLEDGSTIKFAVVEAPVQYSLYRTELLWMYAYNQKH